VCCPGMPPAFLSLMGGGNVPDILRRNAAIECTLHTMQALGPVYFWTLTTPDPVFDPREISRRWNNFLTLMRREYKDRGRARGLRVYERHPGGHGIHIHFVLSKYVPVQRVREIARATGFGRIHVCKWDEERGAVADYLKKYLFKDRDTDWCGVRVYSTFGLQGVATRQADIEITSPKRTLYAGLTAAIIGFAAMPFQIRMEALNKAYFAWLCSEAAEPSEYVRANLVHPSTIQTAPRFDVERAWAAAEIRAWDRGERVAAWEVGRQESFREYNDKAAAAMVARSREWS